MEAVERVGTSGSYVLGQEVAGFEQAFAEQSSVAHAVGCGSGLDAIEIGLRALGIKPGDRVVRHGAAFRLHAFEGCFFVVRRSSQINFCVFH